MYMAKEISFCLVILNIIVLIIDSFKKNIPIFPPALLLSENL